MGLIRFKVTYIQTDGEKRVEEVSTQPSLLRMQEFVGGPVERWAIRVDDGSKRGRAATMWGNEEAQVYDLPVNPLATFICRKSADLMKTQLIQQIYGPVIIVERIPQR